MDNKKLKMLTELTFRCNKLNDLKCRLSVLNGCGRRVNIKVTGYNGTGGVEFDIPNEFICLDWFKSLLENVNSEISRITKEIEDFIQNEK